MPTGGFMFEVLQQPGFSEEPLVLPPALYDAVGVDKQSVTRLQAFFADIEFLMPRPEGNSGGAFQGFDDVSIPKQLSQRMPGIHVPQHPRDAIELPQPTGDE